MALIDRATRLLKADLHAVLDHIEEPVQILALAIREMQDEISRNEQARSCAELALAETESRLASIQQELEALDGELDLCFEQQRDDLARAVCRRKLRLSAARRTLTDAASRYRERIREIAVTTAGQAEAVERYRQKARMLGDRLPAGRSHGLPEDGGRLSEQDIEIAMLRERQARRPS